MMQVTSQCVSLDKWDFGAVKQTLFSVPAYRAGIAQMVVPLSEAHSLTFIVLLGSC